MNEESGRHPPCVYVTLRRRRALCARCACVPRSGAARRVLTWHRLAACKAAEADKDGGAGPSTA